MIKDRFERKQEQPGNRYATKRRGPGRTDGRTGQPSNCGPGVHKEVPRDVFRTRIAAVFGSSIIRVNPLILILTLFSLSEVKQIVNLNLDY